MGCHALLQGISSTQGLNPGLSHCRRNLPAEPPGKPKNTGVGSLSLLQGTFLTQESNRGLLHCRQILYQLSYQGSPQSNSGSSGKLRLQESRLPGLWIRVECAWKTPRPCVSLPLPLKASPFLSDSSRPGTLLSAYMPRRLHSGKRLQLGTPEPADLEVRWPFQDPCGQSIRPPSFGCTRVYGSSQSKPDGQVKRGSIKGTHPDCLNPSPVQS